MRLSRGFELTMPDVAVHEISAGQESQRMSVGSGGLRPSFFLKTGRLERARFRPLPKAKAESWKMKATPR